MKAAKILFAVFVTGLLATASVLAQGRIAFANSSSTPIAIGNPLAGYVILGTASTARFGIGPASVQVSLTAGLTAFSLAPVLIGTAADQPYVLNTASTLAVAQGTFPGGNPLPLPGFDGSAPVFLQMHVISLNGQYRGDSPIISVIPASLPPPTQVFSAFANPNAWDPFDEWYNFLAPSPFKIGVTIPEPSTLALLGMSLPLMFVARRQR